MWATAGHRGTQGQRLLQRVRGSATGRRSARGEVAEPEKIVAEPQQPVTEHDTPNKLFASAGWGISR